MPKPIGKPKTSAITRQVYVLAAHDHVTAASELFKLRRFVLANYVAGLAVECILRAYRMIVSAQFDERHDLYELARAARFFDLFPPDRAESLTASFATVATQWENSHRYRTEDALRRYLTERALFRGLKGDLVEGRTRIMVNAAFDVVSFGVSRWQE
jgi:hypothetical protein